MFPPIDWPLLWNMLFDKALLTGAALFFAHRLSRALENHRANVALTTEAAKVKLERLGSLWAEMNAFEANVRRLFIEFARVALEELRAANVAGVPEDDERGPAHTLLQFATASLEFPDVVEQRILTTMEPLKKAHIDHGNQLWRDIDRARFWIGEEAFAAMKRYHQAVMAADLQLNPTREGVMAGAAALHALDASRQNVDSVIASMLRRPRLWMTAS